MQLISTLQLNKIMYKYRLKTKITCIKNTKSKYNNLIFKEILIKYLMSKKKNKYNKKNISNQNRLIYFNNKIK